MITKRGPEITGLCDHFTESMGRLYKAAHAYIAYWGEFREPTTLSTCGLSIFDGRGRPDLMSYVLDVATFGVKPMSTYHPERSHHQPNSSVMDSPDRTCQDFWGDLVKGRIMLFRK